MADYRDAISSIESGGRYDLLGPVTRSGDRAHGRYQVMGSNIGPWTKEVFGQPMAPKDFLGNPQAQDALFNAKFGQYAQKYGPEGAARAWFAGEGGMNNPNAKDILGTSVGDYARKFNTAMGTDAPGTPGLLGGGAGPMGMGGFASMPGMGGFASMPGTGGLASMSGAGGLLGLLGKGQGQGQSQGPNFTGLMQMGMNQMAPQTQQEPMPMPPPRRPVDLSQLRAMLAAPPQMTGWAV